MTLSWVGSPMLAPGRYGFLNASANTAEPGGGNSECFFPPHSLHYHRLLMIGFVSLPDFLSIINLSSASSQIAKNHFLYSDTPVGECLLRPSLFENVINVP